MTKNIYKVIKPVGIGGRIERGELVELSEKVAKGHVALGNIVLAKEARAAKSPIKNNNVVERPKIVISEMDADDFEAYAAKYKLTAQELKDYAKELVLPTTGTKQDVLERILLALDDIEDGETGQDGQDGETGQDGEAGDGEATDATDGENADGQDGEGSESDEESNG